MNTHKVVESNLDMFWCLARESSSSLCRDSKDAKSVAGGNHDCAIGVNDRGVPCDIIRHISSIRIRSHLMFRGSFLIAPGDGGEGQYRSRHKYVNRNEGDVSAKRPYCRWRKHF